MESSYPYLPQNLGYVHYLERNVKSRSGKTGYTITDQVNMFCQNRGIAHTFSFLVPEPQVISQIDRRLSLKEEDIRSEARMLNAAWDMRQSVSALKDWIGPAKGQRTCRAFRFVPVRGVEMTEDRSGTTIPCRIKANGSAAEQFVNTLTPSMRDLLAGVEFPVRDSDFVNSEGYAPHFENPNSAAAKSAVTEWVVFPDTAEVRAPRAQAILDYALAHVLKRLMPTLTFAAVDPGANWARTVVTCREPAPGFDRSGGLLLSDWIMITMSELMRHDQILDILQDANSKIVVGAARLTELETALTQFAPSGWLVENCSLIPLDRNALDTQDFYRINLNARSSIRNIFEALELIKPALAKELKVGQAQSVPLSHADFLSDLFDMVTPFMEYLHVDQFTEKPYASMLYGESRQKGKFHITADPVYYRTEYYRPDGGGADMWEQHNSRLLGESRAVNLEAMDNMPSIFASGGTPIMTGGSVTIGRYRIPCVQPTGIRYGVRLDPRAAPGRVHVDPNNAWMRVDTQMRTIRSPNKQIEAYEQVIYDLDAWAAPGARSTSARIRRHESPAAQLAVDQAQAIFDHLMSRLDLHNTSSGYFGPSFQANKSVGNNQWARTLPGQFSEIINHATRLSRYGISGLMIPFNLEMLVGLEARVINSNFAITIENPSTEITYSSDVILWADERLQEQIDMGPVGADRTAGVIWSPKL